MGNEIEEDGVDFLADVISKLTKITSLKINLNRNFLK